jgi:hypothetical protein
VFDDADLSASGPVVADAAVAGAASVDGVPKVDEALTAGRYGVDHATVLLGVANDRIAADLDAKASDLADLAQRTRFEPWARRVRDFADLLDADGTEPADPPDDELHIDRLHDTTHLAGTFHGVTGHRVEHILDDATDRMWRQAQRDADTTNRAPAVPSRAVLRARALTELLSVAHNATRTRSGSGPYTDPTLTLTGTINPDSTLHLDHRATTRTGWTLTIDAAQRLEWTTPTGTTIHGQQHGTRTSDRAGPAPPTAAA